LREITKIILHCSGSNNPKHDNVETINQWHFERGFSGIGYHFFISRNGLVFEGRKISAIGAHCEGHNHDSIGICLSGLDNFTPEQLESLEKLIIDLCFVYKIKKENVVGHNYYNKNKLCPNFDWEGERDKWNIQ